MHSRNSFCQHIERLGYRILVCTLMYFVGTSGSPLVAGPPTKNKVEVVVIDPGHGGRDPGAVGAHVREKDIVLSIGLKLGKYIEENFEDVRVIYTRDDDTFVPLHERADIANKNKADLFISIHANALPRSAAIGTETWVMGPAKNESNLEVAKLENQVITLEEDYETKYEGFDPNSADSYIIFSLMQYTYLVQSVQFASFIQNEFRERAKRQDRGVKQAGFVVLWQTTMPSVLVETGFLTHPDEEKYLASQQGQDYLASAMFRAFRNYKDFIEKSSRFEKEPVNPAPVTVFREETAPPASNLPETQDIPGNELKFKVQVLVSKESQDMTGAYFRSYPGVEEFSVGRWYKYAIGNYSSYRECLDFCTRVKEHYPDAFVIAVKNGEIIPLKDAIQEINH